jgi:precorrin-8X/cobalt-precorrin-8 methylmutase
VAVFDRFVVVDWSAQSSPKRGRDSIWVAVHDRGGDTHLSNLATRMAAEEYLAAVIDDATGPTLVGVDFSLGYPAGTAAALGLTGTPWRSIWALLSSLISDDERNANNRFAVAAIVNERITGRAAPFWGCPPSAASPTLTTTKPGSTGGLAMWREVEVRLRAQGHRPFSSWQLLGAGAVGGQSLLGIPTVSRLLDRFEDRVDVWPFTTDAAAPPLSAGSVVVAEVWPTLQRTDPTAHAVRDAQQVAAVARWLATSDIDGVLDDMFTLRSVGPTVGAEEGWVLGVAG